MNMKKSVKRLQLSRETIRELGQDDLRHIAGGQIPEPTPVVWTLPVNQCFSVVVNTGNSVNVCSLGGC